MSDRERALRSLFLRDATRMRPLEEEPLRGWNSRPCGVRTVMALWKQGLSTDAIARELRVRESRVATLLAISRDAKAATTEKRA